MWQNSKTKNLPNSKTKNVTKHQINVKKNRMWQNSECDKTQKLKILQNSKTQNVTKKNSKCDKILKKIKCDKT